MAYKAGEKVLFLDEGQVITTRRLWFLRILVAVLFFNTFFSTQTTSLAGVAGMVIGVIAVYYVGLFVLHEDEEGIEESVIDRSGSLQPTEILNLFDSDEVVTGKEIKRNVDISDTEYKDTDDWWESEGRQRLSENERVQKLDDSGYRWRLIDEIPE